MRTIIAEAVLTFESEHYRIGPAPDELILHYRVASGVYRGPALLLFAVPTCAVEWNAMRGDGVMAFELRQVLRAPSGDFVCARLTGQYDLGDDGYVEALNGGLTSRVTTDLVIRFQTAAKEYRWLNRRLFIARGRRDFPAGRLNVTIFDGEQ
jgi:hypothetical protein